MARNDLKNRKPIGSAIDSELYEKLKKHSEETNIPMSKLLDKAIRLLLEATENK